MKTSEAHGVNYVCPRCDSRLARDRKRRGYVKHLRRTDDGTICPLGPTGERDTGGTTFRTT